MIGIQTRGDNSFTSKFLEKMKKGNALSNLHQYGAEGVRLLSGATPVDENLTATSWAYRIVHERNGPRIEWYNTNNSNGSNVAILIIYGHGTRNGGYVQGRNFVNPAIQPFFDRVANEVWKKVKS